MLTQELYARVFDWFVHFLGILTAARITERSDTKDVTVLDMFGFEDFEPAHPNSLEQLLINFANEALQAVFDRAVILSERELFESEGFSVGSHEIGSSLHDSAACVQTIAGGLKGFVMGNKREASVFRILGSLAQLPKPDENKFFDALHRDMSDREMFPKPHPKDKRDTFIVKHYARPVKCVR